LCGEIQQEEGHPVCLYGKNERSQGRSAREKEGALGARGLETQKKQEGEKRRLTLKRREKLCRGEKKKRDRKKGTRSKR